MRSRVARILLRLLVALALIAGLAAGYVLAGSEWLLRRRHAIPVVPFSSEGAAADSVEGRRMAILIGCLEGCHGPQGEGGEEGAEGVFRATAPPLSQVLPGYSDAELARLVRFGVKRDGVSAVGMPSSTFYPIGDRDLARVISHLRRRPEYAPVRRERRIEILGRIALVTGEWKTSADGVDASAPRWGERPMTTPFERGRYLASIICSECHGRDFQGDAYMASPPLSIVTGYSGEQFDRLMRTGVPISGRDLGIMSRVARAAFREFTEEEVRGLHEFLSSTGDSAGTAPGKTSPAAGSN